MLSLKINDGKGYPFAVFVPTKIACKQLTCDESLFQTKNSRLLLLDKGRELFPVVPP